MNDENLKKYTVEEAREQGRKGGIASGEAKREKKKLRECLTILLENDYGKEGSKVTGREAMAMSAVNAAMHGDWKAWELVRDTVGEKPTDSMILTANVNTPYDELTAEQLRELLKMHENGAI